MELVKYNSVKMKETRYSYTNSIKQINGRRLFLLAQARKYLHE